MSYSRWGGSNWYTYWDASRSGETMQEQVMSCWYSMDDNHQIAWTYDKVDSLLKEHPEYIIRLIQLRYDCSPDEAGELQEYMQEWRMDVKRQFNALL